MPVTLGKWLGNLEQVIYLLSIPSAKWWDIVTPLKDAEKSALLTQRLAACSITASGPAAPL